jgi:hypothetical protein
MSHIYENPVETDVVLISRIESVCVSFQKYVRYIRAHSQRSLCVTCRMIMNFQLASSTAIVDYSKIILLKYTTVLRFEKCVKNDPTKFKIFSSLNFLSSDSKNYGESLQHIKVFRIYITENTMSFVLPCQVI